MNKLLNLIMQGVTEMKKSGKPIKFKRYIRTLSCNKNWSNPENVIELDISTDGKIYIASADVSTPKMDIVHGWLTRIDKKIHSVTCIGKLFDGNCRQYTLFV